MPRTAVVVLYLLACASLEGQTATTTALTSVSPGAPVFGQPVILVATVSPPTASGSVSFMDGGVRVGIARLNNSATAQLTTAFLPAGIHFLRAVYGGNSGAGYLASQSAAQPYTVTAVSGARFATAVNYGAASSAWSMTVGDFNGDGTADLAVANSGGVGALLGNGNGTFQAAVNYGVGSGLASVIVEDFNGDGKADLAVANGLGVSVLLGNGNATFQTAVNYDVGSGPHRWLRGISMDMEVWTWPWSTMTIMT
jgi:hypothetical protein